MGSPDATMSMIQQVRRALLVAYAKGQYLDAVGNNRGVPRPDNTDDDELYRRLVQALAWLPKSLPVSYYSLMAAVFGSQAQARLQVGRAWKIYEVNANEVIIELPVGLTAGSLESSTYTHGASGYAMVSSGPSNTFTASFDLSLSSATTLVGKSIHVETAPGTWTSYTISTYAFSAGVATVVVSASTLPAGGGRFYLEVPGDGASSYRGDYLASGGFQSLYSTAAGPTTNTILVVGNATRSAVAGMTVSIGVSGTVSTRVVSSSSYSGATNVTSVVLTTTDVPGGQSGQLYLQKQEVADTATTPPHGDRVYLTGTGLYQVVEFYLDLLVRATGIKVRLEIV